MIKYYIIYKITNSSNNKIYIGKHATVNINDDYFGSGYYLKNAVKKYGLNFFKKEILFIFSSEEEMNKKEKEIVNEEFLSRPDIYNLKPGGRGGWSKVEHIKGGHISGKQHFKNKTGLFSLNSIKKRTETQKKNKSGIFKPGVAANAFKGKCHTEDFKKFISKITSKAQTGKGNSQYGKKWIFNLELKKSKLIKKEELPTYLSNSWILGRKIKF